MSPQDTSEQDDKAPERPGLFAVISLLVAVAATVAALVFIDSSRRFSGALLIFAGAALVVVWLFTNVSQSPRYRNGIVALFALVLAGSGVFVLIHGNKPPVSASKPAGSSQAKPPSLSFVQSSPAKVPWCRIYQVTVKGSIPAGYRIVMFDSSADPDYNFSGPYNYDGTVSPVPRVPGEFTSQYIFIGDRYASQNGKNISNAGFRAVVIALLVPNPSAAVLAQVVAAPTGWGLQQLPGDLAKTVLDVERNNNVAHCLKRP